MWGILSTSHANRREDNTASTLKKVKVEEHLRGHKRRLQEYTTEPKHISQWYSRHINKRKPKGMPSTLWGMNQLPNIENGIKAVIYLQEKN